MTGGPPMESQDLAALLRAARKSHAAPAAAHGADGEGASSARAPAGCGAGDDDEEAAQERLGQQGSEAGAEASLMEHSGLSDDILGPGDNICV